MLNSAKQPPPLHSPPTFTNKQTSKKFSYLSFHHIIYTISEFIYFWWKFFFYFSKIKFEKILENTFGFQQQKKIAIFVKSETWKNKTLCFTIYLIPGTCPYICIHESETFKDRFASFLGNGRLLMAFTCRKVRQCHLTIMPCITSIIVQNLQWESTIPGRFCTINVKPPIGNQNRLPTL